MSADILPTTPDALSIALKEWAVLIRALREGRQVMLLRKGGIYEAAGEFEVETRTALFFPTYLHEEEQREFLQPCYRQWLIEETRRRPVGDVERLDICGHITHIQHLTRFDGLFRLGSQFVYSNDFLNYRIENMPDKPLFALFVRAFELPEPVYVPLEPDYYGCKSWITLQEPVSVTGARPVLSEHTYNERVRVTQRILASG